LKNAIWQLAGTDRNMLLRQTDRQKLKFELNTIQAEKPVFAAELRGANPSSEATMLLVTLPKASDVQIMLIGSTGKVFSSMKVELPTGTSQVGINNISILPGMYTLLVNCPFGQESLRLIKL
jgi:hypothetical protein